MKKSAAAKRKTSSRSKQTGTPPRAPAQRKRRRRASATAAAPAPARRPRSRPARRRPVPQPVAAYSKDDRNALLLLLAPFAVMAVAVGAIQSLTPLDSIRRQLALRPDPLPVVQGSAAPQELMSPPPKSIAIAAAPVPQIRPKPGREAVGVIAAGATLQTLPPRESIVIRVARKVRAGKCVASAKTAKLPQSTPAGPSVSPSTFGDMVASAARAQTRDLVVYTDKYRQIDFPMGDVPGFYGVCTDVVVRAYRALGIDLQVLVHQARIGTGDTSIDHRRTKTLRRFFERYGESIPVTDFAEDYLPGDIVTYYRAAGRSSQTHIAIVSDVIAPSGRPMIVHNRGWGPQLEDALFASNITGHYRFNHVSSAEQASAGQSAASAALR